MSPLFFLSLAPDLCRPCPRLSLASLPPTFSFSLCFSSAVFQFVVMTINLSWILETTRIQKQFPLSVFVSIDYLVVTRVAMRFPAKIISSCIWVAIPVDWVIFHWYACGADGRSLARCTWLPNFLGWVDLLTHGAPLASARDLLYDAPYYIL